MKYNKLEQQYESQREAKKVKIPFFYKKERLYQND